MRLARNKDNTLMLFPDSGTVGRDGDAWRFYTFSSIIKGDEWFGSAIDSKLFPELKWEDEPIEVELNIVAKAELDDKAKSFIDQALEKEKQHTPQMIHKDYYK